MTIPTEVIAEEPGSANGNLATWLEIAAVLFLVSAPTLADIGCTLIWGSDYHEFAERRRHLEHHTPAAADAVTFETLFTKLRLVPIMLVVMWRSGCGWTRFGLGRPKIVKDLLFGFALWLAVAALDGLIAWAFHRSHPWSSLQPTLPPAMRGLLLAINCCAIGFSEELVLRAYLIPRVEGVTGSVWSGVLLSIAVFGLLHFYHGYVGVIHSLTAGTVWAIGFCLTRRIWPVALSHAMVDFVVSSHAAMMIG